MSSPRRKSRPQIHEHQIDIYQATSVPYVHVQDIEYYHHRDCNAAVDRVDVQDDIMVSHCTTCGMTIESTVASVYVFHDLDEEVW